MRSWRMASEKGRYAISRRAQRRRGRQVLGLQGTCLQIRHSASIQRLIVVELALGQRTPHWHAGSDFSLDDQVSRV